MTMRISPRARTIRHDAAKVVAGQSPARRTTTVPAAAGRPAHSPVTVIDRATGEILRIEEPYKQFSVNDPRRRRSRFEADWYGNWNTARTPAAPPHPAADAPTT